MIAALVLAAALDGDALFDAARKARTDAGFPHYAVYAAVVSFVRNGVAGTDTWDTVEDLRRRLVFSHAISREEQAHPTTPHGINFGVGVTGLSSGSDTLGAGAPPPAGNAGGLTVNAPHPDDPIGQVTLAVDQDFGLAIDPQHIGQTSDANDVSADVKFLPRIGRTGTIARVYDVTVDDPVVEKGEQLQHLSLRPIRDPKRYRLRELWIDAKTSLPVRAIVAGIGNRSPFDDARWHVEFTQYQGGIYIARESALEPLDFGDEGTLSNVTIAFSELKAKNILTPEEALGIASSIGLADP
ncbi:MAG TPA: hypothetical protein VFB22_10820 [Candidatus Baltobacteraceae bacterium]|nr:hypothetical protein [Candidatus Baltobacteraceae bacterium]